MSPSQRATTHDAAAYYFRYIDKAPDGDIVASMIAQRDEVLALASRISEEASRGRYAPDKWSIRGVLDHCTDTERVFAFRAWWFARGFQSPLASFDQDVAASHSGADGREWRSLVTEFRAVRDGTIALFASLSDDAWNTKGIASDMPVTVRGLAWIAVGHVEHHLRILRERYGVA